MCRRSFAGKRRRLEAENKLKVPKGTQPRALFFVALRLKLCKTLAHRGFEGCDVPAGVGNHFTETRVQLMSAGGAGYFRDIAWMEPAAGKNREAISSLFDQRS